MRIIGGYLKGKKISFIKTSSTRPLRDLVKESLFNTIHHSNFINVNIKNSTVLDLYSGIGSFGIECLSREADSVTFVENNSQALEILKENLKKLDLEKKVFLYPYEIKKFLSKININKKFDIIFIDPPFAEKEFKEEIELIKKLKIFKKNHLIVIHRENEQEELDKLIEVKLTKEYGRSKVIFGTLS